MSGGDVMNPRSWRLARSMIAVLFGLVAACSARPADACATLASYGRSGADASRALDECLKRIPSGGRLEMAPGVYRLSRPVIIDRPVRISTAGLAATSPSCGSLPAGRCATLLIDPRVTRPSQMPLTVSASSVNLSHLIVRGVGTTPRQRGYCAQPDQRPSGGGIRVTGSNFSLRRSLLRDFACYTALEVTAAAKRPVIAGNVIGPNGDHRPGEVWADGITIHDSESALVNDNVFTDNTDVQLVLGGCRSCRIENNRFAHSGAFERASFAELMLHSWPNTSGDFTGTVVRGNRIDCGAARSCGYGIMIGAAPWYEGRMNGGTITGNSVRNALLGINIDGLTGPVEIRGNQVAASGGRARSDCGIRDWPAVNVAPKSAHLVRGDPSNRREGSVKTRRCLLNR